MLHSKTRVNLSKFSSAGLLFILSGVLTGCGEQFDATVASERLPRETTPWPEYGGGNGQRFVDLQGITPDNVGNLDVAWIYRTGDVAGERTDTIRSTTAFEVTPILADGRLVFCTPFNRVIALDPLTGGELWAFDPEVDLSGDYGNQLVCRGVAQWRDSDAASGQACASRIFTNTNDGYLIALDTATGAICEDFGEQGRIDLNRGVGEQKWLGEYQLTSAPTVIGNRVVVGGAISDNVRIDAPSGVVRAFDARSGTQSWAFDLAPPDFDYSTGLVSDEGHALGTPNVWGTMVADEARDIVYLPTGNPSPDYYRTGTPDMDYYGTAVVALRGSTGEVVWHFNAVINDFWDFDVGAEPTLLDLDLNGRRVPAIIVATKMGFLFVLDRETGAPLLPVTYQEVPREGPLTAQLSPVQPFPPPAFRVSPEVTADDAWGLTPFDEGQCRDLLASVRTGPLYTPITEQWTVVAPSNIGGINWDGIAVDPRKGRIYARSSNVPFLVRLIRREDFKGREGFDNDVEVARQTGMPYAMARQTMLSSLGLPCSVPPWGFVTAIDIAGSDQLWRVPHGTVRDISPVPIPLPIGVPGMGAPIVTSSGLLFLAGAWENVIRAYDADTGEELWKGELPASPQATPMSYGVRLADGSERQFVVIAAGGHARMGSDMGDHLVAFALPEH